MNRGVDLILLETFSRLDELLLASDADAIVASSEQVPNSANFLLDPFHLDEVYESVEDSGTPAATVTLDFGWGGAAKSVSLVTLARWTAPSDTEVQVTLRDGHPAPGGSVVKQFTYQDLWYPDGGSAPDTATVSAFPLNYYGFSLDSSNPKLLELHAGVKSIRVEIRIKSAGANSLKSWQIGYASVCAGWQPTVGLGWNILHGGTAGGGARIVGQSGGMETSGGWQKRRQVISMAHQPAADDRQFLEHLWMTKGITDPFIFIPQPERDKFFYNDAALFRCVRRWSTGASQVQQNSDGVKWSSAGIDIEEW